MVTLLSDIVSAFLAPHNISSRDLPHREVKVKKFGWRLRSSTRDLAFIVSPSENRLWAPLGVLAYALAQATQSAFVSSNVRSSKSTPLFDARAYPSNAADCFRG
jgi:hypothetical protein